MKDVNTGSMYASLIPSLVEAGNKNHESCRLYIPTPPTCFLGLSTVPSCSSFLNGTIFDGLFYLEFGGSIREVRTTTSLGLAGGSRIATAPGLRESVFEQ